MEHQEHVPLNLGVYMFSNMKDVPSRNNNRERYACWLLKKRSKFQQNVLIEKQVLVNVEGTKMTLMLGDKI